MLIHFTHIKFVNWLKYFIIIQPLLDIFTYFSITYLNINITIGIVIRVLFMAITVLYVINDHHPTRNYTLIYFTLLFSILGISFVLNYFTKPNFHFFSEIQFLIKTVYFPVMFCGILLVLLQDYKLNKKDTIYSSVAIAMMIVSMSLFLSIITNTASRTYAYLKSGFTGWFYAGNELGAIVAICFPLTLIYSIRKTKTIKDMIYWIPSLFLALAALCIGTKVSFFAIFITIFAAFFINFFYWIMYRQSRSTSNNWGKVLLLNIGLLLIYFAVTPFSPSYQNISGDYATISEQTALNGEEDRNENEIVQVSDRKKSAILQSGIVRILLSSRNTYFENIYYDYVDSDVFHKLFGLGYAGFYEQSPKLIEMDFFDLYFSFGILGFLVLNLPFLFVFFQILKNLVTNIRYFFQVENILLLISMVLGLGVSFIAGHVLSAPAVSIYFALVLVLLYLFNYHRMKE